MAIDQKQFFMALIRANAVMALNVYEKGNVEVETVKCMLDVQVSIR